MRLGEGGKDVLYVFVGVYVKRERERETEREEIQCLGCRHFSFKTFFIIRPMICEPDAF